MKNIVITGGSRGIGKESAILLAEAGHRVLILSRNNPEIAHAQIEWRYCNFEDLASVSLLADEICKDIIQVDVLIHNAGYLVNAPFSEISVEALECSYRVNVFGPFVLTQKLQPVLSGAHIIGISSMGGLNGSIKFPGLSAYSSSKGAMITLFELLQEELGSKTGQTYNILALGAVQTEMLSAAFPGYEAPLTAKEMAEFVKWFALNGSKYFKGKTLPVSVSTP